MSCDIINDDCENFLKNNNNFNIDLTFFDPPFNQNKDYPTHNDNMNTKDYWDWMVRILKLINNYTTGGGAIYFMQREKNTKFVLDALHKTNWVFQNLIIWKKKSSAVPCNDRFGKHYQIIAFATKGLKARIFNKLRIDPPLLENEKIKRPNGMYVTDVWDNIRELTSGYFAGDEPLRNLNGERLHNQQSPIKLLTRIILSSSKIGDFIFDPFCGTGTTLIVSKQLERDSIGIEIDKNYYIKIKERIENIRDIDMIDKIYNDYKYTENLNEIWPKNIPEDVLTKGKYLF